MRVRFTVAYDGTAFRGFAAQPDVPTVAGQLAAALEPVLGHPVELTCAGRTDAGVHAWGQVVTFDAAADRADPRRLQASVNRQCAPDIVVREADLVAPTFDARSSATSRVYRYTVLNRPMPDPFLARTTWHIPEALELRSMAAACDPLIGTHDFSSFCRAARRADGEPASLVRRVVDARWEDLGAGVLRFTVEASAFCHQMVRSLVGTLVEVGAGRRRAGEVRGIIEAKDRSAAGQLAPPSGLCLWEVRYPEAGMDAVGRG